MSHNKNTIEAPIKTARQRCQSVSATYNLPLTNQLSLLIMRQMVCNVSTWQLISSNCKLLLSASKHARLVHQRERRLKAMLMTNTDGDEELNRWFTLGSSACNHGLAWGMTLIQQRGRQDEKKDSRGPRFFFSVSNIYPPMFKPSDDEELNPASPLLITWYEGAWEIMQTPAQALMGSNRQYDRLPAAYSRSPCTLTIKIK